jgi:hypothetical protein
MELLFEFLGEFLLQILVEWAAGVGFRALGSSFAPRTKPVLAEIGFLLWGVLAGGLSLLVLPHSFIANPQLRPINLVVTPVAAGLVMLLLGKIRMRRGKLLMRLDRFGYAFLFAAGMALIRFFFAK